MKAQKWIARCAVAGLLMTIASSARAQADKGDADLAKALQAKHVALSMGLAGAASDGKPISAMFEYEDAKLKLSVFVEKTGGIFTEVFLDPATGKVLSNDKLTEEDDIKMTRKYSAAIHNAKATLESALTKALAANAGYTAVKIIPAIKNGYAVAQVTLIKGTTFKTVTEPLS